MSFNNELDARSTAIVEAHNTDGAEAAEGAAEHECVNLARHVDDVLRGHHVARARRGQRTHPAAV